MKKLTREEADMMPVKRGRSSVVRTAVMQMKPGEIMLLEKKDWKRVNGPGQMLTELKKSYKMEFIWSTVATGTGWIIERVK